jgi:hypothetical protein
MSDTVELGDKVKCRVTGFSGTVVGILNYLNGCRQIGIQPKVDKEGKIKETSWIDDSQVQIIKKQHVVVNKRDIGGPVLNSIKSFGLK